MKPPSSNKGSLNIFLTLQKTLQIKPKFNFESPDTFQVNKKVNKKVNKRVNIDDQ